MKKGIFDGMMKKTVMVEDLKKEFKY